MLSPSLKAEVNKRLRKPGPDSLPLTPQGSRL